MLSETPNTYKANNKEPMVNVKAIHEVGTMIFTDTHDNAVTRLIWLAQNGFSAVMNYDRPYTHEVEEVEI